ncbi:MAG: hypothetical protein JW889_07420 [Verrucomicrobia bacterium]|nr:hypothetical protein [Verrucomicrobiota bacterium]
MKRWLLSSLVLAAIALLAVGGCDDDYGSSRLVVINNTHSTVLVEVDEHADGDIDVGATMPPGSRTDWVLDAGWVVVFVDGDGTEVFLDEDFDGVFEIADR